MNKLSLPAKLTPALLASGLLALGLFLMIGLHFFPVKQPVPPGPQQVSAAPVSTINKPLEILLPGTVQSRQAVVISAEISGRISELAVTEGQQVSAGQMLAHIEGTAETAVQTTTPAAAGAAASSHVQSQSSYDSLVKEYERYEKLYKLGAIARKQFEDISARLQAAREALGDSSQDTAAPVVSSSVSFQPAAVNLTAPSSGKVTGLAAANGKTVQAGQQLMALDAGGDVQVVAQLEQQTLYVVSAGTPVEIAVADTSGQRLAGQVEAIYPEGSIDKPLFLAHIRVDNSNGLLKSEVPVQVHLTTGQSVAVPALPRSAVFQDQGLSYVYLAVDNQAVKQQVTTGIQIGDLVEITSTLPEQAAVITSDIRNLHAGDEITLQ